MTIPRVPEPTTLSAVEEAQIYHKMDFATVNERFVADLASRTVGRQVIDLGCGPADIAIRLCRRIETAEVLGIDAEVEMLEIAKVEVDIAGFLDRITLHQADVATMFDYEDAMADTVISNSVIHHLDDPAAGLATAFRLVRPGGRIFIRDLARPKTSERVEDLVQLHAQNEEPAAQQLLRQSLHAALTLDEIQNLAGGLGIDATSVQMTSDRHWTLDGTRPA